MVRPAAGTLEGSPREAAAAKRGGSPATADDLRVIVDYLHRHITHVTESTDPTCDTLVTMKRAALW